MTATTDRAALYRSILERPEDDVVRRVFADYLRDNGEEARADFIEVQLELAEMDPCASSGNWIKCVELPSECRYCCLRRREVELWTDYKFCGRLEGEKLFGACPWASAVDLRKTRLGIGKFAAVSRGFVSSIRCELAFWVGGRCRCYTPYGSGTIITGRNGGTVETCPDCKGTPGRTPAHGPRIVAEQPVERVDAIGKEPLGNHGVDGYFGGDPDSPADAWFWIRDPYPVINQTEWQVPNEIYDLMPTGEYESPELALAALSLALVNWARREAGLPPLREHATA